MASLGWPDAMPPGFLVSIQCCLDFRHASQTVASDPTPSVDGDRSSSGEESSAAEVAAARGGRGMIGEQQGLDARGAEARARAMTEAKARLR